MTSIDFDPLLAAELEALVPLDEQARGDWRDVEHRAGGSRRSPTLLLAATLAAMLVALLVTPLGGALVRGVGDLSSWLTGSPAPESVVSDFGSYAPQLGFDPEPGRAVLVAQDGDVILYATINKQGTYCLVASTPWKRPDKLPDGGTCISRAYAAAPLIAGLVGASSSADGTQIYVIAGRTTDAAARTIRFSDPTGAPIERAIGSSGFFVATVETDEPACESGDWRPAFDVIGANGDERENVTITLGSATVPGGCSFEAPHP